MKQARMVTDDPTPNGSMGTRTSGTQRATSAPPPKAARDSPPQPRRAHCAQVRISPPPTPTTLLTRPLIPPSHGIHRSTKLNFLHHGPFPNSSNTQQTLASSTALLLPIPPPTNNKTRQQHISLRTMQVTHGVSGTYTRADSNQECDAPQWPHDYTPCAHTTAAILSCLALHRNTGDRQKDALRRLH